VLKFISLWISLAENVIIVKQSGYYAVVVYVRKLVKIFYCDQNQGHN